MTRINCVPPNWLRDKMLVAEYRELPRVFGLMRRYTGNCDDLPRQYVMGKGHVRFFYNKGKYLVNRQQVIIDEMIMRGFNPQYTDPAQLSIGVRSDLMGGWKPTKRDQRVNIERLKDRNGVKP
jgi:deoxyribonuclease (pyrimidine dimer)